MRIRTFFFRTSLSFTWPLLCGQLLGCQCREDRPMNPFGVTSALPASDSTQPSSASPVASASARPAPAHFVDSTKAPAGATRWTLGGVALAAPEGFRFERAVRFDADGDGNVETFAWLERVDPQRADPGELWVFPHAGAPRRVLAAPTFIPGGSGCSRELALEQTGPQSVTIDLTGRCAATASRLPNRVVMAVSPLMAAPLLVALRLANAAPGERLLVRSSTADRDGDGRDDAELRVGVEVDGSSVFAKLAWLDRPAGASREGSEPHASMAALARTERQRKRTAGKRSTDLSPLVLRLASALCAEATVPRVLDGEGSPFRCGDFTPFADDLAEAQLRSALAAGDTLGALGVLERDGWLLAPLSSKQREKLSADVEKQLKLVSPRARALPATLKAEQPTTIHWSPLAFEPTGKLLVVQSGAALRVDADGVAVEGDAPTSWPLAVEVGGAALTTAVPSCDRNDVTLMAGATAHGTALLAPRPGSCTGTPVDLHVVPVALKGGALEAFIEGAAVGPRGSDAEAAMRPTAPGAPRSPDGRTLAVPLKRAVFVRNAGTDELWRSDGTVGLRDCVPANGGNVVACVRSDSGLVLLERP